MGERRADDLGRFLTLADVAQVLNVSVDQAHELVRSGELPAIHLSTNLGNSGQWRIDRAELEAFLESKYEETRRMNLWYQSDFSDLPELTIERRRAE